MTTLILWFLTNFSRVGSKKMLSSINYLSCVFFFSWVAYSLISEVIPTQYGEMRTFIRPATLIAHGGSWTCRQCLGRGRSSRVRFLSNTPLASKPPMTSYRIPRRKIAVATAAGILGAGMIVASWDDLRHGYIAAKRTGRVFVTLIICMVE